MLRAMAGDGTRVLFIGGTERGYELLRALVARGTIPVEVFCLEEDAHEQERWSPLIAEMCEQHGIPAQTTKRIRAEDSRRIVEELRPDLVVALGWRTMIPMDVVRCAPLGCVGVHDSLLPRYRGFAPTNWAIINGEAESGVTLFHLAEGVDEGDVVDQRRIPVGERWSAWDLYRHVVTESVAVVIENLDALLAGTAARRPQDHSLATYGCSRTPDDGEIDWSAPTAVVDRLVRGLAPPYPGAFTFLGGDRIVVAAAEPHPDPPLYVGRICGRVVSAGATGVDVLTGDGVLRVTEVVPPGASAGDRVPAADVVKSVKARLGR